MPLGFMVVYILGKKTKKNLNSFSGLCIPMNVSLVKVSSLQRSTMAWVAGLTSVKFYHGFKNGKSILINITSVKL